MTAYTTQLRAVPGLERCTRGQLGSLARRCERIDVRAGAVIVAPGDRWVGTLIIVHGEAVAETGGWQVVMPAGARLDRTASPSTSADLTVRARTDARVLAVARRHD
jgi:hypothetical protein